MAQQNLNYGSAANDGNGDGLRDTFIKVEANFTELYNDVTDIKKTHGWGWYADAQTAPATQTITTTPSKLQIDGGTY